MRWKAQGFSSAWTVGFKLLDVAKLGQRQSRKNLTPRRTLSLAWVLLIAVPTLKVSISLPILGTHILDFQRAWTLGFKPGKLWVCGSELFENAEVFDSKSQRFCFWKVWRIVEVEKTKGFFKAWGPQNIARISPPGKRPLSLA